MMKFDRTKAITILEKALKKIPGLRKSEFQSPAHVEFIQSTGLDLERIFGIDSTITKNFSSIPYRFAGTVIANPLEFEHKRATLDHKAYLNGLGAAEGILQSAISQLKEHGADRILTESRIMREGARVFISHGKETPSLKKVERFVRALGLMPVIVKIEPSEGLALDDLVEKRMEESDCALILATADDEVEGRRQPRPNVIHEIGLAQEKFTHKVIYLKENGCEFPSNVTPKVWENFTQENMEAAFEKICKELKAFGLI